MVVTRFVCVSDTHGYSTKEGAFQLPKGDVLIHAGDITKQGTAAELNKSLEWILKADFEMKVIIAGNHDITLDHAFYAKHHMRFHNQNPESAEDCINLLTQNPSLVYLNHETRSIRLTKPGGPRTAFKIFGSPYSPGDTDRWAFRYPPDSTVASDLWDRIPQDADVVVTHTPPWNHCDINYGRNVGCETLRRALWRVRPRLAVCGHAHPSRGYDRVWWDVADSEGFGELHSESGALPPLGSKKQNLADLTGRKQRRLCNDGTMAWSSSPDNSKAGSADVPEPTVGVGSDDIQVPSALYPGKSSDLPFNPQSNIKPGRNETCIVNAAILANSYPFIGGKKFNAPIIVDLDLPPDTSVEVQE